MITSIDQIKLMAAGKEEEIPGWNKDEKITVRVKRVSLLNLASKGQIPNSLLGAAQQLFTNSINGTGKGADLKDIAQVMKLVAMDTLVEPSMEDLNSINVDLTDEQIVTLFNYSQTGVIQLERFHKE